MSQIKLEELKNWNQLTPAEQERLRKVYGDSPDITKTVAQKAKRGEYYKKDHEK